jgi:hypothetical protein
MVASAQIFHTLLYEENECSAKGETNPFCDPKEG